VVVIVQRRMAGAVHGANQRIVTRPPHGTLVGRLDRFSPPVEQDQHWQPGPRGTRMTGRVDGPLVAHSSTSTCPRTSGEASADLAPTEALAVGAPGSGSWREQAAE